MKLPNFLSLILTCLLITPQQCQAIMPQVGGQQTQREPLPLENEEEQEEDEFDDKEEFDDVEFGEDEDFEGDELEERLREAIRIKERASKQASIFRQRSEIADRQIRLIRELKLLRAKLEGIERHLDEGDFENERDAEEAEEALAIQGSRLDEKFILLEVLDRKMDLLHLYDELQGENLKSESEAVKRLDKRLDGAALQVSKIYRAVRSGDAEEFEIEEWLEEQAGDFDEQIEILYLKMELHFARKEGLDDEVRELEEELRFFGEEMEGGEGDSEHENDGRSENQSRRIPELNLPKPILISQQEIAAASKLDFAKDIQPLLQTYCQDCHAGTDATSDLAIDNLSNQTPFVINRRHWENITQQIRVRSMPPTDSEQPNDENRRLMVAWLQNEIENFDYRSVSSPGHEPTRRLTHEEYNNTIRDLLGVDLRPADQFPADLTASSGFHNSANSLFIQPVTMERYLGSAEWVVHQAASTIKPAPTYQKMLQLLKERSPSAAIAHFANRAFRRPLDDEELSKLVDFYTQHAKESSPEQALQKTMEVILVSPSFLMRSSQQAQQAQSLVSDYELASRLSYFLWASMPDDTLFTLARDGKLQNPDELAAQARRMLADPRALTLGTQFLAQWLGTVNLKRVPRDQIDNPWATDSLVKAMEDESALFFYSLLRDNAPIERFIDADYTFLNAELAKHYDIDGVRGKNMQRVSLADNPRGGIFGQASVLTITSFPGRTSPVVRGNWILSELLGTPPPPPPPNVSEFDERIQERRLSQRQKLELHRQNPNCYACHNEIDPLGFALENFENFGQFRNRRPSDTTGKLPSGLEVNGIEGLRKAIVTERRNDLVQQMTRKLLAYALGRQLEYYDEASIRDIIAKFEAEDRRMQSLIRLIIQSETFRKQGLPPVNLANR
ncbi:MAG: DUF1592 domain-containing protein [Planctomycetota bacterium]